MIYINDLLNLKINGSIVSYADDTIILCHGQTNKDATQYLNESLEEVSTWLAQNYLSLNLDKTVYMPFGSINKKKNNDIEFSKVKIGNFNIKRVANAKYLGIHFESDMKWKYHVHATTKKVRYLIFVFRKLAPFMNISTLRMIYFALFHSIATYGIIAWGGAYDNAIDSLQKVQDKILKIIYGTHSNNLPMNLKKYFKYKSLIYHYESISSMYAKSLSVTRNKSINIPKLNRTIGFKNSYLIAIKLFNLLPNAIKKTYLSDNVRKNKLKDYVIKL